MRRSGAELCKRRDGGGSTAAPGLRSLATRQAAAAVVRCVCSRRARRASKARHRCGTGSPVPVRCTSCPLIKGDLARFSATQRDLGRLSATRPRPLRRCATLRNSTQLCATRPRHRSNRGAAIATHGRPSSSSPLPAPLRPSFAPGCVAACTACSLAIETCV